MKKITAVFALALAVLVLLFVHTTQAQLAGKVYRIGTIQGSPESISGSRNWNAFLQGLRNLGYIEGKNLMIEYRYRKDNPAKQLDLAKELVQQKVDVIFVTTTGGISAAKKATKTIPIVMRSSIDPVDAGFVDSLRTSRREYYGDHPPQGRFSPETHGVA